MSSTSSAASVPISAVSHPSSHRFNAHPPAWAISPSLDHSNVVLEMFKEAGIILHHFRLGKHRANTFGREEGIVTHYINHPSLSRQHAAIIHTQSPPPSTSSSSSSSSTPSLSSAPLSSPSGLVLVDLHSSHHTFLNSIQLLSGEPYPLYDGDIIRFGGSTRQYKLSALGRKRETEEEKQVVSLLNGTSEEKKAEEERRKVKEGAAAAAAAAKAGTNGSSSSSNKRPRDETGSSQSKGKGHGVTSPHSSSSSSSKQSRPSLVRASHILLKHRDSRKPVSHRGPITRTREEAREGVLKQLHLLDEVKAKSSDGSDELRSRFAEIASGMSDCTSSKRGGDLGPFDFKTMQPKFSEAAFALKVGEISDLVETDSGVHIILRTE